MSFPRNWMEDPDPEGLTPPEVELCPHNRPVDDCDNCAELAAEQWLNVFYGSSAPQTLVEQSQAAWKEKQALRPTAEGQRRR